MTAPTGWPVSLAQHNGTCPNCHQGIRQGELITKPPGRAWRHESCDNRKRAAHLLPPKSAR